MPALLLFLAQVASPSINFDLATLSPQPADCHHAIADEIIVCGRPKPQPSVRDDQRFTQDPLLPKAEIGLTKNARLSVETQAASVGGFQSNRAMLRLKVAF